MAGSKYKYVFKEVKDVVKETGIRSSDGVAYIISKKHPNINPTDLGRAIRYHKIIDKLDEKVDVQLSSKPVVVFLDVETSPIIAAAWSFWSNPMQSMVFKRPMILSWSAKYLFDSNVFSDVLTPEEVNTNNDSRIIRTMWDIVDKADVLIAHNGKKFDFKVLNTRFIENKLPKPSSYQFVDTLLHCKKQFRWESNRLDYIAKDIFKIDGKMDTPKNLWYDVINGQYLNNGGTAEKQAEALKIMREYNEEDVRVLEDVYFLIRSYIKPHPNLAIHIDTNIESCPTCTSSNLKTVSKYITYVNLFDELRCKDCGSTMRSRKSKTPKEITKRLTVPTPH